MHLSIAAESGSTMLKYVVYSFMGFTITCDLQLETI